MNLSEEEISNLTLNMSFEQIYNFYTNDYWVWERLLRSMINNYFIRHLDNTNEDEPQEVEIPVLFNNASDLIDSPIITQMWISGDGDVCLHEKDIDCIMDLGDYSPYQLMSILETYSKNYEHECDTVSD